MIKLGPLIYDSLHINVVYRYVKLMVWEMIITGDMIYSVVQKIKVKNVIFMFPTPSFHWFLTMAIFITNIFPKHFWLSSDKYK